MGEAFVGKRDILAVGNLVNINGDTLGPNEGIVLFALEESL